MLPLEVVFYLLVAIWGMIGMIRGFSKEIGGSISIVLAMSVLRFFGPKIIDVTNAVVGKLTSFKITTAASVPAGADPFCYAPSSEQFTFYTLVFTAIVFMGYLIAGNLWYFLDKCARYNVPALGIQNVGVLSSTAQTLVRILPFNVLSEPILLMGLLFLLLILRIVK